MMKFFPLIIIAFTLGFCKNNNSVGRYISEKDTTFNKDIRDISAKINKDPENPDLYYRRGNTFYYLEKYKDAITDFKTAVALKTNDAVYHNMLGETYLKLDSADSKSAMEQFDKAIELNAKYAQAKLNKGKLLLARQDYTAAKKMFTDIAAEGDMKDKGMLYLGICFKETKDTAEALKFFEKATVLNPDNLDASLQMANIYLNKQNPLALKYFDKVLASEEFNYEALFGKGIYYQRNSQPELALKLYDKVREVNPAHKLAFYNSAVLYMMKNNFEKSIDYCEKLLEIDGNYVNALSLKGFCNEKIGNKKAALEDYKAAIEIDPKNVLAIEGLKVLEKN